MPKHAIAHHPIPGRFATEVDGQQAHLDYEMAGDVMHITHTIVPDAIAGRGIAGDLVQAAFELARQEMWRVKPVCSYAEGWVAKHPQYKEMLA